MILLDGSSPPTTSTYSTTISYLVVAKASAGAGHRDLLPRLPPLPPAACCLPTAAPAFWKGLAVVEGRAEGTLPPSQPPYCLPWGRKTRLLGSGRELLLRMRPKAVQFLGMMQYKHRIQAESAIRTMIFTRRDRRGRNWCWRRVPPQYCRPMWATTMTPR